MITKILSKRFSNLIRVKYTDIHSKNSKEFFKIIHDAYGKDGLGIMVVENVPSLDEKRKKLFQRIHKLAHLSEKSLKELRVEGNPAVGWAVGEESFEDVTDTSKGSFYVNLPNTKGEAEYDNIWPDEIPDFEKCFTAVAREMQKTGLVITRHIDNYIKSVYPSYEDKLSYNQINTSSFTTARHLYYYPTQKQKAGTIENWCGFHNDHGSITGLLKAGYYHDETGKEVEESFKKSGLYIQGRNGEVVKANFGGSDIAYQIGETIQYLSGGLLHATPHMVQKHDDIPDKIGRITLALFMQPNKDARLNIPNECKFSDIQTSNIYSVPKIQDRIQENMTFGDFDKKTIESYYKKY